MSIVLLVDDDPDIRELYSVVLRNMGHRAFTAPDGRAGLDIAEMLEPDLIIVDLNMPRMNGIALSERLREHGRLSQVPILLHSGEKIPCPSSVDAFLLKSSGLAAFTAAVARLLKRAAPPSSTGT